MPLFRVTKKLATALHVRLPKKPIEVENPDHEWFADLFYVERKKCVIWVHGPTLFTFGRPAVVGRDLWDFPALFRLEFLTAVAAMGLPASLIDRFGVKQPAIYAPTNNRGVVGSMLDYRVMFTHAVAYEGGFDRADTRHISLTLNDSPMSVLKMRSAVDVVRRLVESRDELH